MNSRERLTATLNHRQPDRVCIDFGSTAVTGMGVGAIHRLRQTLLGASDYRVKVNEPYQMLGEIDPGFRAAMGIDVTGIPTPRTMFGFAAAGEKPFTMHDGTPVRVPERFNTTTEPDGSILIYPEGDFSVPPSGRMPAGGWFFDSIIRQEPLVESELDPARNMEEFSLLSDADVAYYAAAARRLHEQTDQGLIMTIPGLALGDIALVPGPWMKHPRGIRDIEEWYISVMARPDYVLRIYEHQTEVALKNIKLLAEAVGDRVQAVFVSGTDFGTQSGLFMPVETFRRMYKPFYRTINDAIHARTGWKTFIHSCGAVRDLIPEFIEAGFDILNPVQTSAVNMDPRELKQEFGKDLVFWGGGVNTQKTLPFGTPEEVYREVRERIEIFGEGGGFVFNSIHNVQSNIPIENLLALHRALADARSEALPV